jgi:hypothetical protein
MMSIAPDCAMRNKRSGTARAARAKLAKPWSVGAPDTNRTCDLPLRRGLLYPLSYRGASLDSTACDFSTPLGR